MIDIARIDHWAANGASSFHRASVLSKFLFLLCVIAAAVVTKDPEPLAAVFALLYAISLRGGWWTYALLLLKAVTPAYAVGMVVASTPYPRIFSFLGTFLPEVVAAGMFMAYRTLFILLDMMDNFGTAIRLRGGFSPGNIVKNGSNIAKGVGMLLVRAVERSQRLYAVMAVRGYNGSMAEKTVGTFGGSDWLPLGAGIAVLALVLLWE